MDVATELDDARSHGLSACSTRIDIKVVTAPTLVKKKEKGSTEELEGPCNVDFGGRIQLSFLHMQVSGQPSLMHVYGIAGASTL